MQIVHFAVLASYLLVVVGLAPVAAAAAHEAEANKESPAESSQTLKSSSEGPDGSHFDSSGRSLFWKSDHAIGTVRKLLDGGSKSMKDFRTDFEHETKRLQEWTYNEAIALKNAADERVSHFLVEQEKITEYCQTVKKEMRGNRAAAQALCDQRRAATKAEKKSDLEILRQEKKNRHRAAIDSHLKYLTDLELRVKGAKMLVKMGWKALSPHVRKVDTVYYERSEVEFLELITSMDEICDEINNDMAEAKQILYANVCVAVDGLDREVLPSEELEFSDNFKDGIEIAFAKEGVDVEVYYVSIVEQHMEEEKARRMLARRVLKMRVSASYTCSCDDGSTTLKGDVVRRELPGSTGRTRNLVKRVSNKYSNSGRFLPEEEGPADMIWYSDVEKNFAEVLGESIEFAFDNMVSVEAFPCSEM